MRISDWSSDVCSSDLADFMEAPYLARSRWLAAHVLPHEPAVRAWLRRTTQISDSDIDDIVQETYAVLARIESVDSIRDPRSYAMQVAKSVFLQTLRKNKVISIGSILDLAALGDVDDAPGPEQHAHGQSDRKCVVSGKSGSGRVDLGGRSNIKK